MTLRVCLAAAGLQTAAHPGLQFTQTAAQWWLEMTGLRHSEKCVTIQPCLGNCLARLDLLELIFLFRVGATLVIIANIIYKHLNASKDIEIKNCIYIYY